MPRKKKGSKKGKKAPVKAEPVKAPVEEKDDMPALEQESEPQPAPVAEPEPAAPAAEDTTLVLEDGGIVKEILVAGSGGTPPPGVEVKVHYVGTLLDGTKFDSSRDRDEFFTFPLGKGRVIKGWDKGVATMKKGEKSILTCKPEFAYGESGSPPKIPPNATLNFEVELFDWEVKKENICTGVDKLVINAGEGFPKPDDFAIVTLSYQGRVGGEDGEIFVDQSAQEIHLDNPDFSEGFVEAVKGLSQGEKAKIFISANMAAGTKDAPGGSDLFYTMEIVEMKNGTATWQMNTQQKLDQATKIKGLGNTFYTRGHHARAIKKYNKALEVVQYEKEAGDLQGDIDTLKLSCYSNMTACNLKQEDYTAAVENATKALEMDAKHVKSLFRRGEAQFKLGQDENARADFTALVAADPNNKPGKAYLAAVNKKINKAKAKERALFKNMFSRVTLADQPNGGYTKEEKKDLLPDDYSSDSDSDDEPPPLEEDTPPAAPAAAAAAPAPAAEEKPVEKKQEKQQNNKNNNKQQNNKNNNKQNNKNNSNKQNNQNNRAPENPWTGIAECYLATAEKLK